MHGSQSLWIDETKIFAHGNFDIHFNHRKMVLAINSNGNENPAVKQAFWAGSGL